MIGLVLDLISSYKHFYLCVWTRNMKEPVIIYWKLHLYKLRPVSRDSLILFIKFRMVFEFLCQGQNGVKLWKGEFVLAQILAVLVYHLPTWVILRMSQNNEHSKQLASSKKQPSNSLWHLFVPSSKANKSQDSPRYIPFQLQV